MTPMPADAPPLESGERYCLFDTAVGTCGVAWNGRGLTRLQLPESDGRATEERLRAHAINPRPDRPPPEIRRAIGQIQRGLAGRRVDLSSIALDLTGNSPFHRQVYEAARGVGWGQTASYGDLARRAGSPGAARAVGQALSRNPVALVIPCHRILGSDGSLTGYAGGLDTKRRLLALEGALGELPLG